MVNQLLYEMDGIDRSPSEGERAAVLGHYLEGPPKKDLDFAAISKETNGYSGADIEALCEEAKLVQIRQESGTGEEHLLTNEDLVNLVRGNKTRGAAVQAWYVSAVKALKLAKETGEEAFYGELAADLAVQPPRSLTPDHLAGTYR